MATFNFGNFQFNSSKVLIFSKKYWNHFQLCQLSIFPTFNFGNFQFWQFPILATCNFGNLQFWQLAILATYNLTTFNPNNFQFWQFSILAIFKQNFCIDPRRRRTTTYRLYGSCDQKSVVFIWLHMLFYFTGIVGLIWCLLWVSLAYDSPDQHPW